MTLTRWFTHPSRLCALGCGVLLPALAGCDRAPAISILGSLFPAWLFCLVLGVLLSAAVHWLFGRTRLAGTLDPPVLVYPCLVAVFTMGLWLVFYS